MRPVARFAWSVLAYNIAVIAWGAFVRASGSGAGCGEHWPLCNGEVLPRSPGVATIIEYSHRLSSGLALLAVLALLLWIVKASRRGHPARIGGALSLFFITTEAAVGAGLVLFQLVADNATMARAMFMAVHLVNTFFLLGALTLTAWWLSGGAPLTARHRAPMVAAVVSGCAGLLLAGASGAVAALGDTLFPATRLTDALWSDLSTSSHLLIRLRLFHPFFAVGAGLLVAFLAPRLARGRGASAARMARVVGGLVALQIGLGLLNVLLLAPIWLQLVHLLMADAIWIGFVLVGADALSEPTFRAVAAEAA
jgi:heme A synthase